MHAHDRADLLALRGHPRVRQLAGASALADPLGGGFAGSIRVSDVNVATKADHVAKAKFREKGEQLLITEAAISEYGDAAVGEYEFGQPPQARILEIVAVKLQFVLPDGQPQQRGRATMAGTRCKASVAWSS